MDRAAALKVGKIIADRWWRHYKPIMLTRQNIERRQKWQQKSDFGRQA